VLEIAKDGVVLYAQGYGYADLKACIRARVDTPYAIGSVTKQFTAAAILQLQNAGSVDIDKPLVTYLPTYAFDPRITLRMLLNQTSGLADYLGFPPPAGWLNGLSQQAVLSAIVQAPLRFTPGSAFQYSNSNYFILGAVIEAVTSTPYADYLSAHILQPANLTQTSYQQPLQAALPYSYDNPVVAGTQGLAIGQLPDSSVYFSAGALWSTVSDLALWDAALRQGKIVPKALLTEMTTPPVGVPDPQNAGAPSTYAMGWATASVPGHQFVWHNGQTLAYTAFNGLFLDDGFSVSVLTNVDIQENTPFLDFAGQLIQTICAASTTASTC
jgi:CubicO group peptidase (beta-lactamase class C family)